MGQTERSQALLHLLQSNQETRKEHTLDTMTFKHTAVFIAVLACTLFFVRAAEARKLMQTAEDIVGALEGFNGQLADTAGEFFVGVFIGGLSDVPGLGPVFSSFLEGFFELGGQT